MPSNHHDDEALLDQVVEEYCAPRAGVANYHNSAYSDWRALGWTPPLPDGWTMDSMDVIAMQLVDILVADVEGNVRGLREYGYEYERGVDYMEIPKAADLAGIVGERLRGAGYAATWGEVWVPGQAVEVIERGIRIGDARHRADLR